MRSSQLTGLVGGRCTVDGEAGRRDAPKVRRRLLITCKGGTVKGGGGGKHVPLLDQTEPNYPTVLD